ALRFNMQLMDMGESELTATSQGDGHYSAQGGNLAMAGPWQIDVIVRRSGRDDVRVPVVVDVSTPPAPSAAPSAPTRGEANLVLGIELLLVALGTIGLIVWALGQRRRLVR